MAPADLLPDETSDERDVGWGDDEPGRDGPDDDRFLSEVPPHHGG